MKGTAFGRRYGRALLELAEEQNQLPKVQRDLEGLLATWNESRELRDVFENPSVTDEARKQVLEAIGKRLGLSPLVLNTLRLLADRRRIRQLPELVEAFTVLAQEKQGGLVAEVTSATDLPATYYSKLQMKLEKSLGAKVTLVKKTDPDLIGGVVTRIGDKVYDGSVRSRLAQLREGMLR